MIKAGKPRWFLFQFVLRQENYDDVQVGIEEVYGLGREIGFISDCLFILVQTSRYKKYKNSRPNNI